ncbi:MAG TPA: dienelactone hydrolase family protein [Candidatus Limnocylindrales bacterium]|nr:dienelactone hydrolase family protein [Candidatus Limnocylindrales bacterium]
MCFDADSRPPIEPIAGGALDHASVTLTGADGRPFRAFEARPADPSGAGILILPDVRGLHPFFEELALRFAEHGVAALAIDYFGRTAGTEPREPEFEYRPHVEQTRWPNLAGDIRAGAARLRAMDPAPTALFATGFCMGGRLASDAATLGLGLAGAIPFYGWPIGDSGNGSPAPADVAGQIECPILAIYGGADQGIGPDVRAAYDGALDAAGVDHRSIVYDGAPHSFFDRKATEFKDASEGAWRETLAFIERRTASA